MKREEHPYDIQQLAEKWLAGTLTPEEEDYFEKWYAAFNDEELHLTDSSFRNASTLKKNTYQNLIAKIGQTPRQQSAFLPLTIAATLLLACGLVLFWKSGTDHSTTVANIAPGGNKAILSFADGRQIPLSSAHSGIVIRSDQLLYNDGTPIDKKDTQGNSGGWNTITTPKGGQYQVILPDSSRVWLNAASSLRYPVSFSANERIVELIGEAYFEVESSQQHPFKVKTARQEVEVLGTHFNVSNYPTEEVIRTTLLQGRVKVTNTTNAVSRLLEPGQQALQQGYLLTINEMDTTNAVAWKNGLFAFYDEPLTEIMAKIARWYDVDVVYEEGVNKKLLFGGAVSRYDHVSKVLDKLELTGGIKFKIEGRRIMVTK